MKKAYLLAFLLISTFFFACKDENISTDLNPNLNAARNNTLAEDIIQDVFRILHQAGYDTALHQQGEKEIFAATVFYDTLQDSTFIRVFYPNWNVVCPDSLKRKGQITLNMDGSFDESGSSGKIRFISFAVQNILLEGSLSFENPGKLNDSTPAFKLATSGIKFFLSDSLNTFTWESRQDISWVSGSATSQDFGDDIFHFTANSKGYSEDDQYFTSTSISPLVKSSTCRWIHGGSCQFSTSGLEVKQGEIVFRDADSCQSHFDMYFDGTHYYDSFEKIYGMY
ncbi:MAG: hypothetical protein U5Q03_05865 [Bacteroidota bacterium]|nr:hypothetical protein [Bacteroidota bacterium]